MNSDVTTPDAVLRFWFEEITPAQHWKVDPDLDEQIRDRFAEPHGQANRCELFEWRSTPRGRLAEVIVLDQFSRNMYRRQVRSFASDPLALALAQEAVAAGADDGLSLEERGFLYMPYMHSESPRIHAFAEPLFKERSSENTYGFALRHKAIIDRFGRYPHRNAILGRESSEQELAFLMQADSSF
jgi:uncharacterized protein (DUF924 family)